MGLNGLLSKEANKDTDTNRLACITSNDKNTAVCFREEPYSDEIWRLLAVLVSFDLLGDGTMKHVQTFSFTDLKGLYKTTTARALNRDVGVKINKSYNWI